MTFQLYIKHVLDIFGHVMGILNMKYMSWLLRFVDYGLKKSIALVFGRDCPFMYMSHTLMPYLEWLLNHKHILLLVQEFVRYSLIFNQI